MQVSILKKGREPVNVRIIIGIGGAGISVAHAIAGCIEKAAGEPPPLILVADTDRADTDRAYEGVSREHQFFLGGFEISRAVSLLDKEAWSPPELARIRPFAGLATLNYGAAASPDLGRLALNFHKRSLLSWVSRAIKHAVRSPGDLVEVVAVGSLVGGTGAGVMPELGGIIQRALAELRQPGWVVGLGLGAHLFSYLSPVWMDLVENQERSLQWLGGELTGGDGHENARYDNFYLADPAESMLRDEMIRQISETVAQSWIALRQGARLKFEAGEKDGMLLLSLESGGAPQLNILWGPGDELVSLPTEPAGELYRVFFHVPTFRTRWAEQIKALSRIISDPQATERQIQDFLGQHPGFLTGVDYQRAEPQVQLQGRAKGALIPDFMLVPFTGTLADIVELKHPQHKVLVNAARYPRFSVAVANALAQLQAYERYFDEEENRRFLFDKHGFTAYKPRLSLIIGRSSAVPSAIVFRSVAAEYPGVDILTYDDVVERAQRLLG